MTIDERRWTYEQVAKQIEREDNMYHARLNSCVVVNLALLAAVATQINFPGLGLKNLIIIFGCSAAGYVITRGIRSAIADGDIQLEYLRGFFTDMGSEPYRLVRPFMSEDGPGPEEVAKPSTSITRLFKRIWPGRKSPAYSWTSIALVFQGMWVAIPVLALLVFFFPDIIA